MANKGMNSKVILPSNFTPASNRTNIAASDNIVTAMSKSAKYFNDLQDVAFTGNYANLSGTPDIPTVNNGTLTIQQNGTTKATFTANQAGNVTADITVPTTPADIGAAPLTSSSTIDFVGEGLSLTKPGETNHIFDIVPYTMISTGNRRNDFYFRSPDGNNNTFFLIQNNSSYIGFGWTPNGAQGERLLELSCIQNNFSAKLTRTDSQQNHPDIFKFNWNGVGDFIGKRNDLGTAALSGSTLDLWYETIRFNGNQILTNGNHNSIFRGKDLTNVYTIEEMYEMIHDGSFADLYLGDYFTVTINTDLYTIFTGSTFVTGTTYYERSGADLNHWVYTPTTDTEPQSGKTYYTMTAITKDINLMYAAFDYYYNVGSPALTSHNAVLIPRESDGFKWNAPMNLTNTVEGGYFNSYMHQTILPCYAKSLKAALNNHMLTHRTYLTTVTDATIPSMAGGGQIGASKKGAWCDTELQLMSERQVFGNTSWSSSSIDSGVDNKILPVFNYINPMEYMNYAFWLRDVSVSFGFAWVAAMGSASANTSAYWSGVRPLMLFG